MNQVRFKLRRVLIPSYVALTVSRTSVNGIHFVVHEMPLKLSASRAMQRKLFDQLELVLGSWVRLLFHALPLQPRHGALLGKSKRIMSLDIVAQFRRTGRYYWRRLGDAESNWLVGAYLWAVVHDEWGF